MLLPLPKIGKVNEMNVTPTSERSKMEDPETTHLKVLLQVLLEGGLLHSPLELVVKLQI